MLLIPVKCLAILSAVWNFTTFGFLEKPQHRGAGSQVSDTKQKRQTIGGAKRRQQDRRLVEVIGK
jgi:hypothetical protein